jgi:FeS assembly SUF system protein
MSDDTNIAADPAAAAAGEDPGKPKFPVPPADDPNPELRRQVIDMLRTCYDPEIPVDIYELGLIYDIDLDAAGNVAVKMTLTSPMCPVAGSLPPEVERKLAGIDAAREVRVDLVWEPTWDKDMMSEAAKVQLNLI